MLRPLPPAPSFTLPEARKPLLSVEISVVTPLFGGGALPAQPDPLLPIRGSSVRGQLRFWWRACKAAGFASAVELYAAESRIWGAAADEKAKLGPSAIDIDVEILDAGRRLSLAEWTNRYPSYVTFPFRPPQSKFPVDANEGIHFRLTLSLAAHAKQEERRELERQAEAALWAWISFGGVGARTRRGCGSLFCRDARFLPQSPLANWLEEMVDRHVVHSGGNLLVPTLAGARLVYDGQPVAPFDAWRKAAARWQEFRQRRKGEPLRWRDAPSVRQALGIRSAHGEPVDPYYPRADLGLPIIFQYLDKPEPRLQGAGDGMTRMASPIIIKPLAVSPSGALPTALLLNAPHVWDQAAPGVALIRGDHGRGTVLPKNELDASEPGARDAFLKHAAQAWRMGEVTL